jgi:hypothetical protein
MDIVSTGTFLVVCGGNKVIFSMDAIRWYRGKSEVSCYAMAYGKDRCVLEGYTSAYNNKLYCALVTSHLPIYL